MTKPLSSTSSFAWRGQEGSVTDRASGLVYMQARHYDPSIGRFIQADAPERVYARVIVSHVGPRAMTAWLIGATFEAPDPKEKARLAATEMRARLVLEAFRKRGTN